MCGRFLLCARGFCVIMLPYMRMRRPDVKKLLIIFCSVFLAVPAAAKPDIKFSVMMLHYNLQYVAGDTAIENKIIEHSLDPMLDFFLAHPGWGADFEMQGYMLEQTKIRFPETFEKLKTLANRGQIDIVSFHFSDQLFLAYPRRDMEWSEMLNRNTFESLGVRRSGTVFTQEGQSGEGQAAYMKDNGFSILCFPKNLYRYWQGEVQAAPYYALRGVNVVLCGSGVNYSGDEADVKLEWTYFNDAELLPTGGATPYADVFQRNQEALDKFAQRLSDLESRGYKIGTIAQYVDALKQAGVAPAAMKPILDGDWQPIDTRNIFRWMGDYHFQYERDNEVLTTNVKARHKLLAAETAINFLRPDHDVSELDAKFYIAARHLMLAEVSDSTGWTPWPGEVDYSLSNAAQASDAASEIINDAKGIIGADILRIDPLTGSVGALDMERDEPVFEQVPCPVASTLTGRITKSEIICREINNSQWQMVVKFKTTDWHSNDVRVIFPRTEDVITYSPALTDNEVVMYPLSAFSPENGAWMYIPAPNGLIGLGNGLFLIKDTSTVNVTFNVPIGEPVVSLDMLKPPNRVYEWKFLLIKGSADDALAAADALNVRPIVIQ